LQGTLHRFGVSRVTVGSLIYKDYCKILTEYPNGHSKSFREMICSPLGRYVFVIPGVYSKENISTFPGSFVL
ncbi:MAG: hypothetical protein WBJ30_00950, partial [Tepidanaerobacteraceae bacterium]